MGDEKRWVRLCGLFDLPIRGGRLFKAAGGGKRDVLVFRLEGGALRAYDAACPHAGALLRPENEMSGTLICFLHHWRFDVATGGCVDVPQRPLVAYEVEARGMDIMLALTDGAGGVAAP